MLRDSAQCRACSNARPREALRALPIDKPERPLRVGIVGELYVLMEPFSNMDVER